MGDGNQKGRSARAALWFNLSGTTVPQLQPGHMGFRGLLLVAAAP